MEKYAEVVAAIRGAYPSYKVACLPFVIGVQLTYDEERWSANLAEIIGGSSRRPAPALSAAAQNRITKRSVIAAARATFNSWQTRPTATQNLSAAASGVGGEVPCWLADCLAGSDMAAVETESGPPYEFRKSGPSHELRETGNWHPSQGGGSKEQDSRFGATLSGDWLPSPQGGGSFRQGSRVEATLPGDWLPSPQGGGSFRQGSRVEATLPGDWLPSPHGRQGFRNPDVRVSGFGFRVSGFGVRLRTVEEVFGLHLTCYDLI